MQRLGGRTEYSLSYPYLSFFPASSMGFCQIVSCRFRVASAFPPEGVCLFWP